MPLITKAAIDAQQLWREPGLWATVVSLSSKTIGDSVMIAFVDLQRAFSLHPRLEVQPVVNQVWVPGADIRHGLGDMVERLAKPIAKALKLPCLDSGGHLKPDSGCGRRRDALNRLGRKLRLLKEG